MATSILDLAERSIKTNGGALEALKENPASLIYIVYAFGFFCFVGTLSYYHCKLVSRSLTTYEQIKKMYNEENPFSSGSCCANWGRIICEPYWPHLADPQDIIVDIDDD